ncbi:expressed unknown protein [Seminavis robusta]|uniref:Kinetochore protein Spc24 n=1 Tax=Seminavis robusta TaxID=568900 RepID=A0A9N8HW29_9STRA|nr:expressed unknown protein [Seminavis robusta]|eukprot:Sro1908_g304740.1 n/a (251) ;mRNA; r:8500-9378
MGKRRGDDVLVASVPAVVTETIFTAAMSPSPSSRPAGANNHSPPSWIDSASFDHKLMVVRENLKLDVSSMDDFLAEVEHCQGKMHDFQRKQEDIKASSQSIQDRLMEKIQQEEAKCQVESANVETMEKELQEIAQERDSIANDIADLNRMRDDLTQRIAMAVEEASQQVEDINMVDEARKNQVPRLKHQISLYADTTGIKWDFEDDKRLEGHVSISSKQVVRSFSIDPQDHTKFEIANKLWGIMDTSQRL